MDGSGGKAVRVYLHGSFRVEDSKGRDLTPTSAKAQALIALLVTAQNGTRNRPWLQSKLWSDRGPQQAAGSLRQCLVQIRRALGEQCAFITTSRQRVSLDMSQVEVAAPNGLELLEGLDVRDEEFEAWLRETRAMDFASPVSMPAASVAPIEQRVLRRKTIVIETEAAGGELLWLTRLMADGAAQQLRETFSTDIVIGNGGELPENSWCVQIAACPLGQNELGIRISLTNQSTNQLYWSDSRKIEMRGAPPIEHPDLRLLSNQLVEAIADKLFLDGPENDNCPDTLYRRAIRTLFQMTPGSVAAADDMLAKAYELQPRGLYLAWRAQVKTIQKAERHFDDDAPLLAAGEEFCAKALETEPNNSMVLATVANTLGHLMRADERSLHLAKRGVLLNPSNPMAWWALSSASVYAGDEKMSYEHALVARRLALLSPHRFWWDSVLIGASLIHGKAEEAEKYAKMTASQNPKFRPPLRYLIAFYANNGREEDAIKTAETLRLLEDDFSIERLVKDRDYPASLLHRSRDIELQKVASLI